MKNNTANTSRTSKSRTATSIPANGASASTPPDFILEGELAGRCAALAKQHGVTPEAIVQKAVESMLGKAENGPSPVDLSLNEAQRSALVAYQLDADKTMSRYVQKAADDVRKLADQMQDLPPTPNFDLLNDGESPDYYDVLTRDGIFLPVPGLLGEVAIPQSKALLALAEMVVNFQSEIMVQISENYPELRRQSAEAVLLAEYLWLKLQGYNSKSARLGAVESDAQLFWRWAQTGTDFEEFEKLRDEVHRHAAARRARDEARRTASNAAA